MPAELYRALTIKRMWVSFQYTLVYDCVQSLKLKNAWNLINRLKSLKWMSYYLNTFKFPGKIWTSQITGITEITDRQRLCSRIYVRKSQEKKFLEKRPEVKSPQISEVLEQNVIGNKVLSFRFLGLFFLK